MKNVWRQQGFTLVELLITVGIICILTLVSLWLYSSQVRKSRRSDAMNTIMAISLAQERYRSSNAQYGTLAQVWGGVTTTPGGYYTIAISGTSATGYTITATPSGTQASDSQNGTSCSPLQLTVSSGTVTKSPTACWSD